MQTDSRCHEGPVRRISDRPLYNDFAWTYDRIIAGDVSGRCDFVQSVAAQRGVPPGSVILDAGCGTGSYSVELARRGYAVTGLDVSDALLSVARAKAEKAAACVTFRVGDLLELPRRPKYDGVLCRGVLNDLIDSRCRQQALVSLGRALRTGGILVLDVRDWTNSALKKEKEPVFERTVEIDCGTLAFRSLTRLEYETRRLLIKESYMFRRNDGTTTTAEYDFVMRCWTREELQEGLNNAGAGSVVYFGDYDSGCSIGSTDRIIAIASF